MTKQELHEVVFTFEKFWSYFISTKVIVNTDHISLRYFMEKKILCQGWSNGFYFYKNLILRLSIEKAPKMKFQTIYPAIRKKDA